MRNQWMVLVALSATVLVPICSYAEETTKTTEKSKVETKTTVYKTEQKAVGNATGTAAEPLRQDTTPNAGADRYQFQQYASAGDRWQSKNNMNSAADKYRSKNTNGSDPSGKSTKIRI